MDALLMNTNLKIKIINACLLLSSFIGYLEWGNNQHSFIFQVEAELFLKARDHAEGFTHPLILVPLLGQLIILFTLFQKKPARLLSLLGLTCLSIFILFLFFIGLLETNLKIIFSTLPFLITGIFVIKYNWKSK